MQSWRHAVQPGAVIVAVRFEFCVLARGSKVTLVFLRNVDPPIWYDTDVKLFEIQRV